MLLLTGSMLSALGAVIIQRTAALSLNWDPEGFCLKAGSWERRRKRERGGGGTDGRGGKKEIERQAKKGKG